MGRHYDDPDPLHGNGKAIPKPKRPTHYSYRGSRPMTIQRSQIKAFKDKQEAKKARGVTPKHFSVVAMLKTLTRLVRRSNRQPVST